MLEGSSSLNGYHKHRNRKTNGYHAQTLGRQHVDHHGLPGMVNAGPSARKGNLHVHTGIQIEVSIVNLDDGIQLNADRVLPQDDGENNV